MLGDYSGNPHLQGELLANLFDLIIRDATNGARSMDDVMRKMMEKFSGERGFDGKDIEVVLKEISGRDFHQFFEDHVRGNKLIDFNKYLALLGMKMNISLIDATNAEGNQIADLRVYVFQNDGEKSVRFATTDPQSVWAKAGLHTGYILKSVNDEPVKDDREFFGMIRGLKIGDTVVIEIEKPAGPQKIPVVITGYKRTMVVITEVPGASDRQKNLLRSWEGGVK
jgi:predicted metalloprotease with PDZ domain